MEKYMMVNFDFTKILTSNFFGSMVYLFFDLFVFLFCISTQFVVFP